MAGCKIARTPETMRRPLSLRTFLFRLVAASIYRTLDKIRVTLAQEEQDLDAELHSWRIAEEVPSLDLAQYLLFNAG